MEPVMTYEKAREEVEAWLNYKRVRPQKREDLKDEIETITHAISEGILSLDHDKMVFTHQLLFPLDTMQDVTYKPRITGEEIANRMRGVKANDVDARILGYASAVTTRGSALLNKMDTEDMAICQAIARFFV